MRTSAAGIAIIKKYEGCKLTAYRDVVGVLTIGYGDTLNVHQGMTITQQEAEDGLAGRLAREFEPGVLQALQGAPVSQPQLDAMVSLAWNIGIGGFGKSSVAQRHRAGDYAGAADAFLWWNKAGGAVLAGLQRRRAEERALYLSAVPTAAQVSPDIKIPAHANNNCAEVDPDLVADLVRALQRVVGTKPDGIHGPKTAAAVQQAQRRAA